MQRITIRLVDNLKNAVGWLLLVIWLPAASLCLIERAELLTNDDCCPSSTPESAPGNPSSDSTCCTLASASYKADEYSQLHITAPLFIGVLIFGVAIETELVQVAGNANDLGPPTLLKTWQFTSRAALAPRAPSFAS